MSRATSWRKMIDGGGKGKASSSMARPPRLFNLLTLSVRKERALEGFRVPLVLGGGVLSMFFGTVGGIGGGASLLSLCGFLSF